MKKLLFVILLGCFVVAGCNNPFSLDREMDEFTGVMTDTAGIIASNTLVLPP